MGQKILVIDDDRDVLDLVDVTLRESGYAVVKAQDGHTGIEAYNTHRPDLVVLDIGLGRMTGLEVLSKLRASGNTPVVFLTAKDGEVDQLVGLAVGADDYITKPFSPRVLGARIATVLRRAEAGRTEPRSLIEVGPLVIDLEARTVAMEGTELDLTRTEFDLLAALAENPQRVVTREALLERVWGSWYGDTHVVEVHMSRLRSKVRKATGVRLGAAVRGVGYRLGLTAGTVGTEPGADDA